MRVRTMAQAGPAGCCCRRYSLLWIALLQRSVTRLSERGKECGARPAEGRDGRAGGAEPSPVPGQRRPEQPGLPESCASPRFILHRMRAGQAG